MIPACDQTGTPLHFHSSITSGSACLMRTRSRASISPRQSLSSLILASISREGESPFPSFEPLVFMSVVAFFMVDSAAVRDRSRASPHTRPSHAFARQLAGLLHPIGKLTFVELVVLVDVKVAYVLVLGLAGRHRTQRCAAEESHFNVLREAVKVEEPALALDAIEGRVPFDRLAHAGGGAHDERVEAAPDLAFPARHGRDVGLHRHVAVGLRDLRVAACQEDWLCD